MEERGAALSVSTHLTRCPLCSLETSLGPDRLTPVSPNIRSIRNEVFHVWRCAGCESIHAFEEVDLDRYYQAYNVFEDDRLDFASRAFCKKSLGHLREVGVTPSDRVLDYGCGSGRFVRFLREQGFSANGYDRYSPRFRDEGVLGEPYDVVYAQDVVEHATEPVAMFRTLDALVKPGGLLVLGTPNASGIDLARPGEFVHQLHVPYHRHIFSERALRDVGARTGWEEVRFFPHSFHYTMFPFLNLRYGHFYLASHDNTIDVLLDPPRLTWRLLLHPMAYVYGFFGSFMPLRSDCQIVFRKGDPRAKMAGGAA